MWRPGVQGFTMIELLVVIAILGLLAAVAMFSVSGVSDRGAASACKAEVSTVNAANQAFYAEKKAFPNASPPNPSVTDLGKTLQQAEVLTRGVNLPGATAANSPAYDPTNGRFTADC